jgi:hypothetical protein
LVSALLKRCGLVLTIRVSGSKESQPAFDKFGSSGYKRADD